MSRGNSTDPNDYDNDQTHNLGAGHDGDHQDHHIHMVVDFRWRFWISLVFTVPIMVYRRSVWIIELLVGQESAIYFSETLKSRYPRFVEYLRSRHFEPAGWTEVGA